MKILKYLTFAVALGVTAISCDNGAEEAETIEVEENDSMEMEENNPDDQASDNQENDDGGVGIDVSVDDEGNVDGEASGNIEIGDEDDDKK